MTTNHESRSTIAAQRLKLTIAYRGTRYHGWQTQAVPPNWKGPRPTDGTGLPSVQETVNLALREVLRHPVSCVGSSRTDGGVHAKGQVAHVDTMHAQIPADGLRRAINHQLPEDIIVRAIERVPRTFDAIFATVNKRYQYAIWNHPERPVFGGDLYFHRWRPLDVEAMRAAAAHLVGTHDFSSFCKPGHGRETTVRTVFDLDVSRRGPMIVIGVEGSGFLWNQVRIMAGTLVEVGEGTYKPEQMPAILSACDRRRAGKTAPPHGLYLQWVKHDPNKIDDWVRPEPVDAGE